jgi:hypothetical protein
LLGTPGEFCIRFWVKIAMFWSLLPKKNLANDAKFDMRLCQIIVKRRQLLLGTPDNFLHSFWVKIAIFWSLLPNKSGEIDLRCLKKCGKQRQWLLGTPD